MSMPAVSSSLSSSSVVKKVQIFWMFVVVAATFVVEQVGAQSEFGSGWVVTSKGARSCGATCAIQPGVLICSVDPMNQLDTDAEASFVISLPKLTNPPVKTVEELNNTVSLGFFPAIRRKVLYYVVGGSTDFSEVAAEGYERLCCCTPSGSNTTTIEFLCPLMAISNP
jgi:hypothetical protein